MLGRVSEGNTKGTLQGRYSFSKLKLVLFIAIFGLIGGYALLHSFAAGNGSSLPTLLGPSTGTTYYVDGTNGNDSNDGLSTGTAFQTISKGISVLAAGNTLFVRGGTYTENPVITKVGTSANPITIQNYIGETPILHNPPCACDNEGFQFNGAAYVRLHGFIVENTLGTSSTNLYIYGSSNHIQIENNELRFSQDQGTFTDNTTSYIYYINNKIHDNGQNHQVGQHQSHSMYIEGSNDLIANNLLYNEPFGFGIQLYPTNHDTIVVNNTIANNGHSGIVLGGSTAPKTFNITIRNNIISNNGNNFGIQMDANCPTGGVVIDHNVFFANNAGTVDSACSTAVDISGGNLSSDPKYVDFVSKDLHIQASSPAIGYALPAWAMVMDYDGNMRDIAPAAGAYEYSSGTLKGDLNADNHVNIFDLSILLSNYNQTGVGDINGDGIINIYDLSMLLSNYGR
jgi:hypothetical protein